MTAATKRHLSRRGVIKGSAALAAASAVPVGWAIAQAKPLKVGLMLPYSGTFAKLGENINFAIKTGALRDFLDNSVVPYQISDAKEELKTADIARNARAFTFLISCKAKAKEKETAKN